MEFLGENPPDSLSGGRAAKHSESSAEPNGIAVNPFKGPKFIFLIRSKSIYRYLGTYQTSDSENYIKTTTKRTKNAKRLFKFYNNHRAPEEPTEIEAPMCSLQPACGCRHIQIENSSSLCVLGVLCALVVIRNWHRYSSSSWLASTEKRFRCLTQPNFSNEFRLGEL